MAVATTAFGGVTAVRADDGQIPGAIVINGRGYGHGRGMSQYGSYGWATTAGWSWQQILDFYYGGATGNVLAALSHTVISCPGSGSAASTLPVAPP